MGNFNEGALRDILGEYSTISQENKQSIICTCPRCSKTKLYFSRRSGRFVCWKCREISGFEGRPEFALVEMTPLPLGEIRKRLYGDFRVASEGVDLTISLNDFFNNDTPDEVILPTAVQWETDHFPLDMPEASRGREYLAGRGIPLEIAQQYGIRYQPRSRRVYFPLEESGRLLGWQGRLVVPNKVLNDQGKLIEIPKALTSRDAPRDSTLMFGDRAKGVDHLVICEGPIDAIKAHFCGGNVATLGKGVSERQIKLIRNSGITKVYLALDPDAMVETSHLIRDLCSEIACYYMRPPAPYGDLGDMPFNEVFKLFTTAQRVDDCSLLLELDPIH